MKTIKLPDKPSALLKLSIKDLKLVEKNPKYQIDMDGWWHAPLKGICHVCLAGSILAKTYKLDMGATLDPCDFDNDTSNKLYALNNFRSGLIRQGLDFMGYSGNKIDNWEPVANYKQNPKQFYEDIQKIIKNLEKNGL